jgi:hypothetical protein
MFVWIDFSARRISIGEGMVGNTKLETTVINIYFLFSYAIHITKRKL